MFHAIFVRGESLKSSRNEVRWPLKWLNTAFLGWNGTISYILVHFSLVLEKDEFSLNPIGPPVTNFSKKSKRIMIEDKIRGCKENFLGNLRSEGFLLSNPEGPNFVLYIRGPSFFVQERREMGGHDIL